MVVQVTRRPRARANRAYSCKYHSAQGLVRGWHVDLEVVQVLRRSRARADRACCSCKYRSAQGLVQGWHGSASTAVLKDLCKPRMLFVQVRWRSRARANRACCLCKYRGAQRLVQTTSYHIVNTACFIKVRNMMKLNQTMKQLVEDKERQTTALRSLSCDYDGSEFQGYSYPTLEKYNERTQTYDVYGHFCSEYCSKRYLLNCCKYLTTDKLVYSNQLHRFLKQQLGITSVYDAPGPSIFLFL